MSVVSSVWISWLIVLAGNSIVLYGNQYYSYLTGLNKIALVARWEIASAAMSVVSSVLVLLFNGGLLELVIATQIWPIVNTMRNFFLCRFVFDGRFSRFRVNNFDFDVWRVAWAPAWRSGLGVIMSSGTVQVTGIVYAQVGEPEQVAQYWICLKLLTLITTFSRAPFYTRIPTLSRLWVSGELGMLISTAWKGMALSSWIFLGGFLSVAFLGNKIFEIFNSSVNFPNRELWALMGIAFLIERIYAFHLQLYSVTNNIIWHIVNGVGGIVMIGLMVYLFPLVSVLAFPISMIISYITFPLFISVQKSYSTFGLSFIRFDLIATALPFSVCVFYSLYVFFN